MFQQQGRSIRHTAHLQKVYGDACLLGIKKYMLPFTIFILPKKIKCSADVEVNKSIINLCYPRVELLFLYDDQQQT